MVSLRQRTELLSLARALERVRGGIHIVIVGTHGDWLVEQLGERMAAGMTLSVVEGLSALEQARVPGHVLVLRVSSPGDRGRELARSLNLHREELVGERLHTVLLLEDDAAHVELQRVAPDLWSFRHRTYAVADASSEEEDDAERRERVAETLAERARAMPGASAGVGVTLVRELMARVGVEVLWEHLGLWRDDGRDPERLDPLVKYLWGAKGAALPQSLVAWQEPLESLRSWVARSLSEGRVSIELPQPQWSAEPAPGGEAAISTVAMLLERVGVAWVTGGASGAAAALASGAGLVLRDEYDGVITLDGREGLASAIAGWLDAAGLSAGSSGVEAGLEQIRAVTGGRRILLVIREASLEDVEILRRVLPSARAIVASASVSVDAHWSGDEGLVVGSRVVGLAQRLGIGPEQKSRLGKIGARLRSVGEFLSGAIEPIAKLGKSELVEAVSSGSGWAGTVARGIKDAAPWAELAGTVVPPIKLLTAIIEHATKEPDPEVLAYLAWSTAYQRSVLQAVSLLADRAVGEGDADELGETVRWAVGQLAKPDEPTIVAPTREGALSQPFIRHADELLDAYAKAAGFGDADRRLLVQHVHDRFRWNLGLILSHGDVREKFAPLVALLDDGGGEDLYARDILRRHADYQRSLFEEARVLRSEPFSLAQVYVPNDCGVLTWGECRGDGTRRGEAEQGGRPDPFDEETGGRKLLLDEVLGRMKDPEFDDVIIVQGVAGSGKSTFTLSLCARLFREGLTPIRVRLRDIDVHQHAKHAIPAQVLYEDDDGHERRPRNPEALFRDLALFDETSVAFGEAKISPYVLVLDGWDELETSGDQRVLERIPRFIDEVRRSFITGPHNTVRVVLTGRPWSAVTRSDASFLGAKTPILTIRSWRPEQLGRFFTKVRHLVDVAPMGWPEGIPAWSVVRSETLAEAKKAYERSWEARKKNVSARIGSALEILGSPLLAHLSVRLLSQGGTDVGSLLSDPTQLYRQLVDQTSISGGRAPEVADEVRRASEFTGDKLRALLQMTAMAMTIEDRERISYEVLEQRIQDLHELHPFKDQELADLVGEASRAFPVAELLIAFFFKGGRRDLGCEFAHKSFREYLFAEALVEVLKSFARMKPPSARKRSRWWSDFSDEDSRQKLIQRLGPVLAAQWLTPDVVTHLGSLLRWEIDRSVEPEVSSEPGSGVVLPAISIEDWARVRDALADLWEWWAEGVHLRSMVRKGRRGDLEEELPYAAELARWIYPADWRTQAELPAPVRTTTIDAHLGDALFRLCGWVHAFVARARGVPDERQEWSEKESNSEYQTVLVADGTEWVRFRPGGAHLDYLQNFIGRINGAGWRPGGRFPFGANLEGANLEGANLEGANLQGAKLQGANLFGANLEGANLFDAKLQGAKLQGANLQRADLFGAKLQRANLFDANLFGANLFDANLQGANLFGANLEGANLFGANLEGANLFGAKLERANLQGAKLQRADLFGANLEGANLQGANLQGANLQRVRSLNLDQLDSCHGLDHAILDEPVRIALLEKKALSD